MKKLKIFATVFFGFLSMAFQNFAQAQNGQVKITVDNVQATEGIVRVSIYKKENFPEEDKAFIIKRYKVTSNTLTISIEVPVGEYAVAIHHDENSNDEMDTNFLGIPSEPYGFSKNYVPTFRAPTFSECNFSVAKGATQILTISLID